jgi:tetratricopeptide (TPR) repeat protein
MYLGAGNTGKAYLTVNEAISGIGADTLLLCTRGFTELEMRDYESAAQSFSEASDSDIGNPAHLLWQAYADFLSAERDSAPDENIYRDYIASVIRTLDKALGMVEPDGKKEALPPWIPKEVERADEDEIRLKSDILRFKSHCYFKLGDYDKSVGALKECAEIDRQNNKEVKRVLKNIWKNNVRPSLWRWWLSQPVNPWPKRVLFFAISLFALGLIAVHPFVEELIYPYEINWAVYIFLIAALFGILFVPLTERKKETGFAFSLTPDLRRDPVLTPVTLDDHIKQIRRNPSV